MKPLMQHGFTALIVCATAATLVSPAAAITIAPSWLPRETVASGIGDIVAHQGQDRILAFDHHGNPGIAFYDAAADALRYARRVPGLGWQHSIVDASANVGHDASLAYDRYERPAISYYDQSNGNLKYAHFNGAAWQIEAIDTVGSVGDYTSLAFDHLGRVAVSYRDITNTSLKFVHDTDGDGSLLDETPVTVVNDFSDGNYSSLVFDPLNRPMIAHQDSTNFDLRFSVAEPGLGWITTTVDSVNFTGLHPSLAIDPDTGFPAIAYHDNTTADLLFAAWNGTSWDIETADGIGSFVGFYASLAFDPADGNPAIAHFESQGGDLRLTWHDGASWQTQVVDAVGDVGQSPSLAFNDFGDGFPSIAYFEEAGSSTDNLYFIEDPLPVPEPAALWLLACGAALVVAGRQRASTAKGDHAQRPIRV